MCGSETKQRLFPYPALTDWFLSERFNPLIPMITICTANLTFNNSTFFPHSVFACFVWIWEQTAIISLYNINLLGPEFGILVLAHSVCKMRIIQEPKKVALWNKWHIEEKKTESVQRVKKNSVCIFVEKHIKLGVLRVAVCAYYI
jgi:hypothetical protein